MNNRKLKLLLPVFLFSLVYSGSSMGGDSLGHFDPGRDLYIAQFDSKTDVDDIHSVAGVGTMLRDPKFAEVSFHGVAGAYGIQDGLYVPSPQLFRLVFGEHWSDAHNDRERALAEVSQRVRATLLAGGQVWAADAGQSDFSADWLARIYAMDLGVPVKNRVHVVQHSDWNESVTAPEKLAYVQANATYHRIEDGNFTGNGTPGFKLESTHLWDRALTAKSAGEYWRVAREIANRYNGAEGRYLNSAIAAGGMDFSDVSESCWIFGFAHLEDADAFFEAFTTRE